MLVFEIACTAKTCPGDPATWKLAGLRPPPVWAIWMALVMPPVLDTVLKGVTVSVPEVPGWANWPNCRGAVADRTTGRATVAEAAPAVCEVACGLPARAGRGANAPIKVAMRARMGKRMGNTGIANQDRRGGRPESRPLLTISCRSQWPNRCRYRRQPFRCRSRSACRRR